MESPTLGTRANGRLGRTCKVAALMMLASSFLLNTAISGQPPAQGGVSDTQLRTERLKRRLKDAFSLVGEWTIIKMDVVHSGATSQPTGEASVGNVSINLASSLGKTGSFVVGEDGKILGSGSALYAIRVGAGSSAFAFGAGSGSLNVPVGAVAQLSGDSGERTFTISGTANLEGRTISLSAFKAGGEPLKVRISPGSARADFAAWPPMTNVSTSVIVAGSSLLCRAAGVVGPFRMAFEAVKYVDLEPILTDLVTLSGVPGPPGPAGPRGPQGPPGPTGPKGGG